MNNNIFFFPFFVASSSPLSFASVAFPRGLLEDIVRRGGLLVGHATSSENLCHVLCSVARCLLACPKRQKRNLVLWQNLDVLTLTLWTAWFSCPPYLKAVPEIGKYLQIHNFCPQAPVRPPLSLVSLSPLAIQLVLFQCSYFVFQFSFESHRFPSARPRVLRLYVHR